MKKLFSLLMILGVLSIGFNAYAQDDAQEGATTEQVENTIPESPDYSDELADTPADSFDQVIKQKFIEGDPTFMSPVLICLILGLAIAIERIISLNMATTNTNKLLSKVEDALESGGVEAAKEVTKSTRGPVASIFTQGLMRMSEGIEMVEKSVIAYGSVEMGRLERGLVWISLFISLAPMLGFMGTVIGMIGAFDAIQAAGDISPSLVAGGIKVALLTTVAGLIVAIILQLFYNYCVSKIDSIVNSMEDASISLVDLLVKHNLSK
ncbi:biopolymer transport protein ExbB [Roseivirga ehrenbergii]|uniref:Flagellar motor protein MotA n=1 Tax=Roseivirga ehrenbergii (strain DSM 102268 / JCM 13514 / KCTC 12282 / NCIMB 14502 / KMM 6017) TaxID=279360 RepID=A0A150XP77_ROSEK|nr:MotA/TolQ/ExbB proton channel family protein [Roseivirga ehrenbergii]KYG80548.1 flagellar motor protein MotA [Roseivirga ehrenbergii]TCL07793.1 biopolymer transport protein ExbB [Roseivirga ehrenbergii]